MIKRMLPAILIMIAVAIVAGCFMLRHIRTSAIPDYNADVALDGLTHEVVIFRDSFAIPHIYAQNEPDLYRATGFAIARDRLWQMDLLRRVTQGRLSKIDPFTCNEVEKRAKYQMKLVP